ncbi:hypothetical protein [Bowmanella pacifica]|uniref:Uncharacterized protein n=1 Tax=Bowmanella pacifica TaxID=502051 RepID=A0A917YTS9_9ALTE|nr:hypothetical protein [Bowmanella pacifica]GGO64092.1 hypothetical protein GCM10010982_02680 [Bowmanella pacifica]
MQKILTGLLLLLVSTLAQANVKCPDAKVQMLYPTEEKTFIQLEGLGWQVLGFAGDEDLPTKMAIAQRAKQQGQPVELTFNNGHDKACLSRDDNSPVIKIKARKEKRNQNG